MAPAQCAKHGRESHPSTVVVEEGRYSLSEKQQGPIAASPPCRTGCPFSHDKGFVSFHVSYHFAFRVTPHGVPNPMYLSVRCLPCPLPLYSSSGEYSISDSVASLLHEVFLRVTDDKLDEEVDEHVDESESTVHAFVRKMFFGKRPQGPCG